MSSVSYKENKRPLRFSAKAGLLPELSRQTYDQFYKAIREAVLNSADAGATRIVVDFSRASTESLISVSDDGSGMGPSGIEHEFLSLGGSGKVADPRKFGRIGIGSLALLHYADEAHLQTKQAGSQIHSEAVLRQGWLDSADGRRAHLDSIQAGSLSTSLYSGAQSDHFTRLTLNGLGESVRAVVADPARFYSLVDDLRRVLPLPSADTRIMRDLEATAPAVWEHLLSINRQCAVPVLIHTPWERDVTLTRRCFGDHPAGSEEWIGPPTAFRQTVRVRSGDRTRRLEVAGFLCAQRHAHTAWSGLTARVQDVAVEEHTFFDVTADPGFRKYITGEVWIGGEVDRERLINIDRASFNRESDDYKAVQRVMAPLIMSFKSGHVQVAQRARTLVRKRLSSHMALVRGTQRLFDVLAHDLGATYVPSTPQRNPFDETVSLPSLLMNEGAGRVFEDASVPADRFVISASDESTAPVVALGKDLAEPAIAISGSYYAFRYGFGPQGGPSVVIRNRPRTVVVNAPRLAFAGVDRILMDLAIDIAFTTCDPDEARDMYELIGILSASLSG